MGIRHLAGKLDHDFVTIYFMQGKKADAKLAVRRLSLIFGILLLIFSGVSLRVWQEMQIVKLGYGINQFRNECNQLLDQQRVLLTQRNTLASLERVEAIARVEMGLVTPRSDQMVFIVDPAEERKSIKKSLWEWLGKIFVSDEGQALM